MGFESSYLMLIYFQNKKLTDSGNINKENNLIKSKNKKRGVRVRFQSKNDLILGSIDSDASTIVT
jgi:hypothetical protein